MKSEQAFKLTELRLSELMRLEEKSHELHSFMTATVAHVDLHVRPTDTSTRVKRSVN